MSDLNAGPEAPEDNGTVDGYTDTAAKPDDAPGAQPDGDTFPRSYVEDLRKENADYRTRTKAAEELADQLGRRLHTALVTASNRLENPADLAYDASHLEDPEQLAAALDALLADRPYMAKRVVKGDVGQGNRGGSVGVSWADLFRDL